MGIAQKTPELQITTPEIWVTRLENTTTGINLLGTRRTPTTHPVSAILNQGLQITLPEGLFCPVGHFVLIDFVVSIRGIRKGMQATGKVLATSNVNESFVVEIEFKIYDKKEWQGLLNHLGSRQQRVDQIFKRIKGE